ncbi:hypothetical protein LX32DRAFT_316853 [Colletotrichum zoysiae]|uniref:Uncharacterized protein n=1 Tax=Colletotrichum zoysiae TaxID=1216348 RepID=A0AAD9HK52_9PEZI|nr:hypothetical protein LX32DRAFT_316853 [Colletotrichum zoysiae]
MSTQSRGLGAHGREWGGEETGEGGERFGRRPADRHPSEGWLWRGSLPKDTADPFSCRSPSVPHRREVKRWVMMVCVVGMPAGKPRSAVKFVLRREGEPKELMAPCII